MKIQHYLLLTLLITTVLLTGCDPYDNGFSQQQSSASTGSGTSTTPPSRPEVVSGAVVTAPIHNASVNIKLNGKLNTIGYTNNGRIHFTNLSLIKEYPVILYANQFQKGHFADGTQVNIMPRGIMMSKDDSPYITPLTTLAALMFEKRPQTQSSAKQIKQELTDFVHNTFGLPHFDPFADPTAEGLSKHEILQQAFLVLLGLGQETDPIAMEEFIPTVTDVVEQMENDTFLGAFQSVNSNISSTIENYINTHKAEITSRASSLLAKRETDPTQQEIARITFLREMNTIVDSGLTPTPTAVLFLTTELNEDKSFLPLAPVIPFPRNSNPIPFHFKVSLLGNVDSIADATANSTKEPAPNYSGEFIITAINSSGILNEGTPLSPNEDMQLSTSSHPFTNGSEFTFFMNSDSKIGSSHQITFAAKSDPSLTTTVTFITKEEDAVIIKSINSTSTKKLFVFDDGGLTTVAKNSSCPLLDDQLSATVKTDINEISSEELAKNIEVRFTLPEGLAFRINGDVRTQYTMNTPTETTSDSFIFTLPSSIDIIATEETSAEKKKVTMQVVDSGTLGILAETKLEGCFVSENALYRIVGIELIDAPSLVQTYPADNEDTIVTLPAFTLSCKLLSWYDLAEIPKEEQPDSPLGYTPQTLKLQFENMENQSSGFVTENGECVHEIDIQPLIYESKNTMLTFGFLNYMPAWKDYRLKLKPFTSRDTIRLVYTECGDPNTERYASGQIIIEAQ